VVHVPWAYALRSTVLPTFHWNVDYITVFVAVLGTTISPYLFFWQAGEEVEDEEANPNEMPLLEDPKQAPQQLHRISLDTATGMAFSNIVAFFIMLTAVVTLHVHGLVNVQTATDAAIALKPVAGKFAFLLFAAGIIGTGLLAVPVMAGSAAYAVGEVLGWPVGLARSPLHARGFYSVLAAGTLIGLALNIHIGHFYINPIKALFWSAVINGVVAGPIMVLMMLMASNSRVMGRFKINRRLKILGWLSTAAMLAAAVGLFATWGH
jgi:Mn2+/Fe2+ NRAMP family transporter